MKAVCVSLALCSGVLRLAAADGQLFLRYLDAQVIDQVMQQREALCEGLPEVRAEQVDAAMGAWRSHQLGALRADLEQRYGGEAKAVFGDFVQRYRTAENEEDVELRSALAQELELDPVPEGYAALQHQALNRPDASLLPEAARFLGEVETWAGLPDGAPSLRAWLTRDLAGSAPTPTPTPKRPVNPLRAAEADGGDWVPPEESATNPMDAFRERREAKRAQALEEAYAGMRQIAGERESWERENAAQEMAKAQADAEAMRAQAQRLAATEEEALAQRENSWGNRLKRIVGGTLSTTIGAFTGGIGAEAGRRASEAVFDTH